MKELTKGPAQVVLWTMPVQGLIMAKITLEQVFNAILPRVWTWLIHYCPSSLEEAASHLEN